MEQVVYYLIKSKLFWGLSELVMADIVMMDNTILNQVRLYKSKELGDSIITTKDEADKILDFESSGTIYFSGQYVQGGLITGRIMEYQIFEENESLDEKIDALIERTSDIYDLNDTAEWIMNNREELLKILR